MKLQEHTDISPCTLAVFAAGHPWWWHMSNIYKYNLNSTLHISSDSLQMKVYYNLKRHFCKAYGKPCTFLFYEQAEGFIQAKKNSYTQVGVHNGILWLSWWIMSFKKIKSSWVFLRMQIHVSSWRCLTLWGPEYAPKYVSMGSCEKEPVKTGKQDPPLLITEWWKPDSKATCHSDPKCRISSVETNNN